MPTSAARPQPTVRPPTTHAAPAPPRELLNRAWAFDDPGSYRAGVQEAIAWMTRGQVAPPGRPGPHE